MLALLNRPLVTRDLSDDRPTRDLSACMLIAEHMTCLVMAQHVLCSPRLHTLQLIDVCLGTKVNNHHVYPNIWGVGYVVTGV
jgi:hypothetical protein